MKYRVEEILNELNTPSALAAAGSTQATAALITERVTRVTGADGTKGVILPVSALGNYRAVYNAGTSALKVYPHVGGDIDDGTTNAAITLSPHTIGQFNLNDSATWAFTGSEGSTAQDFGAAGILTDLIAPSGAATAVSVAITDNVATAFQVKQGSNNYIKCDTTDSAERVTITPATTVTGALTATGGIKTDNIANTTANTALSVLMADNIAIGFEVKEGSNSYIKCNTTDSSERVTITPATTVTGALTVTSTAALNDNVTVADAKNIVVSNNTGTTIATNAAQKLSVHGVTPVIQATFVANVANDANSNINTVIQGLNSALAAIRGFGIMAQS